MFFSLSTIPAKRNKKETTSSANSRIDKFIFRSLIMIWLFLISFALISLFQPQWLINISETEKNEEAMKFKRVGDRYLAENDFVKAVANYNAALKRQPDLYYALGNLAVVYSKTGNYKKAVTILKKMIEVKPEVDYIAKTNLAEIYEKNNILNVAVEYYSEAAADAPFPAHLYTKLGNLYCNVNRFENAIDAFRRSISERSNMKVFFTGMLERDLHRISDHPHIQKTIASMLENGYPENELDRFDETVFLSQLARDKEFAISFSNLGWAYELNDQLELAAQNYRNALKIWPRYLQAMNNLDSVLKKIENESDQ